MEDQATDYVPVSSSDGKQRVAMKIPRVCHKWSVPYRQAVTIQYELSRSVRQTYPDRPLRYVAGVDATYSFNNSFCIAGVVLWDRQKKSVIEQHFRKHALRFPYIPGLLSFREAPAILAVLRTLKRPPDVLLCDGQGIAHPRRLGIASHIGVLTGLPSIGCAKSRLIGRYAEPAPHKGARSSLIDGKERIGTVLRTRDKVRPVFVSVGHLIDLDSAEEIVLACAIKYRLPEPTRLADLLVSAARRTTILHG